MGYTKLVLVFKNSLLICLWCKNTKKKCLLWLFLSILRQNLLHLTSNNRNLIPDFWWLQTILTQVERTGGVYFVPAFSGLFAPHWRWGCFFCFLPKLLTRPLSGPMQGEPCAAWQHIQQGGNHTAFWSERNHLSWLTEIIPVKTYMYV